MPEARTELADLPKGEVSEKISWSGKQLLALAIATLIALTSFIISSNYLPMQASITVGIITYATLLWVLEPIPIALTAFSVILFFNLFNVVPLKQSIAGFSTGSLFLIIAGFMMAQGVNQTTLGQRLAYTVLAKTGSSIKGLLAGIIIAPQLLAVLIPATTVRATLLLPALIGILATLPKHPNIGKLLALGLAFGTSISGVGILTAAVANVVTNELLAEATGNPISYFSWFKLAFPLWLLLIPTVWLILLKVFPVSEQKIESRDQLSKALADLGPLSVNEFKCLLILFVTVALWMMESYHNWHPSIPAMLAVVLMTMPGIGFASWHKLMDISWATVLTLGAILSMGTAINATGLAEIAAGGFLHLAWVEDLLKHPVLSVAALSGFTFVYQLFLTNPSATVGTLVPVIIEVARQLGINPAFCAMVVSLTSLFGFILIVQTMPGIVVYGSGLFSGKDYIKAGFWVSLACILMMTLVGYFWWPLVGWGP